MSDLPVDCKLLVPVTDELAEVLVKADELVRNKPDAFTDAKHYPTVTNMITDLCGGLMSAMGQSEPDLTPALGRPVLDMGYDRSVTRELTWAVHYLRAEKPSSKSPNALSAFRGEMTEQAWTHLHNLHRAVKRAIYMEAVNTLQSVRDDDVRGLLKAAEGLYAG